MKSNEEEYDDQRRVKKRPGGQDEEERSSNKKMQTTPGFNANSPNNSNVAKMPSDNMTKQEASNFVSIPMLSKIYRLEELLADLAGGLKPEEMKPSKMWGVQGAIDSLCEEISRKIYRRAWKVKKVADDDNGPMLVWALCVLVEHLTQCIHRKRLKLSELDKKLFSAMGSSLNSIHGNIDKKRNLVLLMDNLKLSLFKNIDFAESIASYCNIDGSQPGESDGSNEREKEYLEMLSG
jgi:hypothetical protein